MQHVLRFMCPNLSDYMVVIGKYFHKLMRSMPVEILELYLATLVVVSQVQQENVVMYFKDLNFRFLIVVLIENAAARSILGAFSSCFSFASSDFLEISFDGLVVPNGLANFTSKEL